MTHPPADVGEPMGTLTRLTMAGLAIPLVFSALVIAQGLLQPEYSHVALPISALAAWPLGWVQRLNFILAGVLMFAYAIGVHAAVHLGRRGALGPALIAVSGLGLIVAGIIPWRRGDGDFIVPAGHVMGAMMAFLGAALGHILASRRMRGDPRWH